MGRRSVGRALPPRAAIAALLVLLVPASAMADRHTGDAGAGGGRAGRSELGAFVITGDWIPNPNWLCGNIQDGGHDRTLSLAGEFSYASGDHNDGTLSQYVVQVGPRLMWNKYFGRHFQPYLVGLIGVTIEQDYRDRTSLSMAGGFGADVPLVGGQHPWLVFRGQYTWNWIDTKTSDNTYGQWSAAVVFRFEKKKPSASSSRALVPPPPPKP